MNTVCFVVWGRLALFTRPETRTDRVSYSVITPPACEGIANAVAFKPEMEWGVLKIEILRPWWVLKPHAYPRTLSIKRNEVKSAPSVRTIVKTARDGVLPALNVIRDRTQRASLLLSDVAYRVTVRPRIRVQNGGANSETKYVEILTRRLSNGQFFHKPYFGCREFVCDVRLADGSEQVDTAVNLDCGLMIHHMDYREYPPKPVWFHAVVSNGEMDCSLDSVEVFQ